MEPKKNNKKAKKSEITVKRKEIKSYLDKKIEELSWHMGEKEKYDRDTLNDR